MPITRSDTPNLLNPAVKATFLQAYDEAWQQSDWTRICTVIKSDSNEEDYAWLGALPSMREFKDERLIKSLAEYSYTLANQKFESTIGVDVDAINDGKLGALQIRIRGLAQEVVRYKEELVMSKLNSGATDLAYDGSAFFCGTRTIGASGTLDNVDANALNAANLQAGFVKMMAYKDDQGKPLGIRPDTLVVGPDKMLVAMELIGSQYNVDTANANVAMKDNVISKLGLTLIVSPYITATRWFLLDTKKPVKPIILQDREGPIISSLEGNSEIGFMRDQYAYGVKWRGTVGYGLPQTAYYSVG
jgi:phage major head subunit gpT-like protein